MSNVASIERARLHRLLGRPELSRLVERLRRRFEMGGGAQGILVLGNPDEAERRAIEQLMGRAPGRGTSLQIRLETLEQVIRSAGIAPDLYSAIEALGGHLCDRQAERAQQALAWRAVFTGVREQATGLGLAEWLDELEATGLLKRLTRHDMDRARDLLDQALRVVAALPGRGRPLSTLAATMLGDAHALDQGRPLATLVKKAAVIIGGGEEADSPESDREIWAGVGVLVGGALTSTVLVLNLPAGGETMTGQMLGPLRETGQPGYLTLRQLVQDAPHWHCRGSRVYICENPAVVAEAAERLGPRSAPLICTHGQPGAAVVTLLRQLNDAGAELLYHGDFDWPGIRIGNAIMRRFNARPWRFDAAAYRAARHTGNLLTGTPVPACWDEALMPLMEACNHQLEEEQVIDDLLDDLCRGARPCAPTDHTV